MLEVLSQVHGGHAALTELALDPVAIGEGGNESIGHVVISQRQRLGETGH